ncbi:hypothetical protein LT875_002525 [Salmonella enterica]|nr:hypothetical protein [Salmonella enterica]
MLKFLMKLFAPKAPERRPMAIRRKRVNPVYILKPERNHLAGKVGSRITGVSRGDDERTPQHAHDERVPVQRAEL